MQEKVGFGGSQPGAGKPKRPTVTAVLRERVEAKVEEIVDVIFDGLGAEKPVVVGNGPSASMEMVPDYAVRLRAAADALDRVYGKPKQTTEIAGPGGQPIEIAPPRNPQRARDVSRILADAGALPPPQPQHEGRKRRATSASASAKASNGNGNGSGEL